MRQTTPSAVKDERKRQLAAEIRDPSLETLRRKAKAQEDALLRLAN
ncbi:MAG: hypothetical protein R3D02_11915 [Hyphomicrobiales bacterium]